MKPAEGVVVDVVPLSISRRFLDWPRCRTRSLGGSVNVAVEMKPDDDDETASPR